MRNFGFQDLWETAFETVRITAMSFMILAALALFGHAATIIRLLIEIVGQVTINLKPITSRVGMNLFVTEGIAKAPLSDVIGGALPYEALMLASRQSSLCSCPDLLGYAKLEALEANHAPAD